MQLDQLVFDKAPHDPRHLVAVELDDRLCHLDLGHRFPSLLAAENELSLTREDRRRGWARQAEDPGRHISPAEQRNLWPRP